jgi:hypothetical protein
MDGPQSKAAFVIHVRDVAGIESGRLEGKVEHIASYRAARFHGVDELVAFIARVMADIRERDR